VPAATSVAPFDGEMCIGKDGAVCAEKFHVGEFAVPQELVAETYQLYVCAHSIVVQYVVSEIDVASALPSK